MNLKFFFTVTFYNCSSIFKSEDNVQYVYMGEFLLYLEKKKGWHFCSMKKGKSNYILDT